MNEIKLTVLDDVPYVSVLTINRPQFKNALNSELIMQMSAIIDQLEEDNKTSVVILQGSEGNFAAGADIKEMLQSDQKEIDRVVMGVNSLHTKMSNSPIIFIAAIEGYCLGGGFELALACDIRIASSEAIFGLPEVKLGILPGGWGTQKFASLAGTSFAMKYLLTGDFIESEKAHSFGLVSDRVENPWEQSVEMAKKIASHSAHSVQEIKKLITGVEYTALAPGYELERTAFKQLFTKGDAREGLHAFTEKRKPNFGRS
ncbi:hypothetical protein CSV79_13330 [Sporosarcina sp. P13]|uniref:enoyl-CoA hydratase/isomerase family protein n=1 Tax=Sporosarcina sp. P13 TaxID=2048263 RepID=UPI000C163620|nr:enoyl-CoA hydratase/isomerase family protein [Sporosarcina sp. P13]PIC63129.1 hypothetical protein CSV79_13330 [Sporosarcina sp. P13]